MKLRNGIFALGLASALFVITPSISFAVDNQTGLTKSEQLISSAGERSTSTIRENELKKLVQEAINVINETNKLIYLLSQNKVEEAKKVMKELKEKLNKLENNYKIDRFPIDVEVFEIKGTFDLKTAEKLAKKAKEAVNKNDFITGRFLLNTLRDEIVIKTAYLPLKLYKDAINLADKFLNEGKVENAISQLQVAIGTIELETQIIPRPLAIASVLVEDAKKIYQKDYKTALKLLEEAKRNIKLAKVLGYIRDEKDIKPLIETIEKLEEAIKEKQKNSKDIFRHLIEKIKEITSEESKNFK